MSEMIKATVEGTADPFNEGPMAFLFVALTVALAVAQISFINQGLALFDGTLFVPLYTALMIVCGVIYGSVYYDELECLDSLSWVTFPLGVVVVVTASLRLSAVGAKRMMEQRLRDEALRAPVVAVPKLGIDAPGATAAAAVFGGGRGRSGLYVDSGATPSAGDGGGCSSPVHAGRGRTWHDSRERGREEVTNHRRVMI